MSDRSKRRIVAQISDECKNDPLKILMAARYAAKKSHMRELSSVLKDIITNPENCSQMTKAIHAPFLIKPKSPEEALAFIFDNNLSKSVYINMRLETKSCGSDVWPVYDRVREAKELCRPPKEAIHIKENEVECDLQLLLHHTTTRIINMQEEVIVQHAQKTDCHEIEAVIIFSWGFDGTSGFSPYKQYYSKTNAATSDTNLFASTCIPLRLITKNGVILWNNAISQSERFH